MLSEEALQIAQKRSERQKERYTHWITEKAREFQKNVYFFFVDYAKAFDLWITTYCGKFFQELEIPDHLNCLLRYPYVG